MSHKSGFVNIIGSPNVGKSTLMHQLVGEKLSIITSKMQTTRHRIMGMVNEEDYQVVFSDTPGIIDPHYRLHENMMKFVSEALKDADVVMTLRIQYERFESELNLDLEEYKSNYQLTSEKLEYAKGDAIVMHPGPVNYIEITESVYDSDNSVIREQIANGVAIRMAVLSRFLGS